MTRTHEERVLAIVEYLDWCGNADVVEEVIHAYHAELEADNWWVLPAKPTDLMVENGRKAADRPREVWARMIAAAPSPLDPEHHPNSNQSPDKEGNAPVETEAGDTHGR